MLVVTRKVGEGLRIGENIVVTVVQVSSGSIRIGIDAPRDAAIWRAELMRSASEGDEGGRSERIDQEEPASGF